MKHLLPSLREKKRYVVFEVISEQKFESGPIQQTIEKNYLRLFGEIGLSKAGLLFLHEQYNASTQRGIIRVTHKTVDNLRAAFAITKNISGKETIIRSIISSGILNKAAKQLTASEEKEK